MREEQFARLFVLALFAFTLYLLYLVFQPFLSGIAWAIFLATAFHPVYRRLVRLLRGRETTAALLASGLVAALIVVPAVLLALSLARSVTAVVSDFGGTLQRGSGGEPRTLLGAGSEAPQPLEVPGNASRSGPESSRLPLVAEVERILAPYVDVEKLNLEGTAVATIQRLAQALAVQTSSLVQNTLWTLAMFVIMMVTMVSMFREGPRMLEACKRFLPLSQGDRDAVFGRLHEVTRAVFYGVFLTSLIQAALGGVGWAIVGLPSPLTFGIAMFFCSLIPVGGTALVWAPGAAFLFLQGHSVKGTVLVVWGVGIVGLADNILRPFFISGRTRMHTLLVFFGILGGMAAFGVCGLFLGPLLITVFLFLLEVIRRDLFPSDKPSPAGPAPSG